MTFWGFAINYVLRVNINIAIVSMIKSPIKHKNITVASDCVTNTLSLTSNTTTEKNIFTDSDVNNIFNFTIYLDSQMIVAIISTYKL